MTRLSTQTCDSDQTGNTHNFTCPGSTGSENIGPWDRRIRLVVRNLHNAFGSYRFWGLVGLEHTMMPLEPIRWLTESGPNLNV